MHTVGSVTQFIDQVDSQKLRGDDHSHVVHSSFLIDIICPLNMDHPGTFWRHLSARLAANLLAVHESDIPNF